MSTFQKKQGFFIVNPSQETVFPPSRGSSHKIQYFSILHHNVQSLVNKLLELNTLFGHGHQSQISYAFLNNG
jgi:hypothetical protein